MDAAVLQLLQELRSGQATLQKDHRDLQRRLTEWMEHVEANWGSLPCKPKFDTNRSEFRAGNKPRLQTSVHTTNQAPVAMFESTSTAKESKPSKIVCISPRSMTQSSQSTQASAKKPRVSLKESHEFVACDTSRSDLLTAASSVKNNWTMLSSAHWRPRMGRHHCDSQVNVSPVRTFLQRCVRSRPFALTFGFMIVLNAICIGLEVEQSAKQRRPHDLFKAARFAFFVVFTIEFCTRLIALGSSLFFGNEACWNWFDLLMVLSSATELIEHFFDSQSPASRGIARMFRLLRIFRMIRFSPQLRLMLFLIAESLKSLGPVVCLLLSFLYFFSVVFTMAATEYVGVPGSYRYRPHQRYASEVQTYFGSVPKSMFTCWKSMSGGVDWADVADPLLDMDAGWFYCVVFLIFIVFSVLCIMNIVTGVFVDSAMEKTKTDREIVVLRHLKQKKAYVENMRELFKDSCSYGSDTISMHEFHEYLSDEKVQAYFEALRVDTNTIGALFERLDRDDRGEIGIDEFIDNLVHLLGAQAPEQSLQNMINENKAAMRNLLGVLKTMLDMVRAIDASVRRLPNEYRHCIGDLELALRSTAQPFSHCFSSAISSEDAIPRLVSVRAQRAHGVTMQSA